MTFWEWGQGDTISAITGISHSPQDSLSALSPTLLTWVSAVKCWAGGVQQVHSFSIIISLRFWHLLAFNSSQKQLTCDGFNISFGNGKTYEVNQQGAIRSSIYMVTNHNNSHLKVMYCKVKLLQ